MAGKGIEKTRFGHFLPVELFRTAQGKTVAPILPLLPGPMGKETGGGWTAPGYRRPDVMSATKRRTVWLAIGLCVTSAFSPTPSLLCASRLAPCYTPPPAGSSPPGLSTSLPPTHHCWKRTAGHIRNGRIQTASSLVGCRMRLSGTLTQVAAPGPPALAHDQHKPCI